MFLAAAHPRLATSARLPALSRHSAATALEWAALVLLGSSAALLTAYLSLGLRIPGHAILRAVVPMILGLALVPRRGSGLVMSAGAALTAFLVRLSGSGEMPPAAFMGLVLLGPMLDLAAARSRSGRGLYGRFILAGVAANLVVYGVRWGVMVFGFESGGGGKFRNLGLGGLASYVVCGALAGLIGAALAFRSTSSESGNESSP